jgi:hypothetical protein
MHAFTAPVAALLVVSSEQRTSPSKAMPSLRGPAVLLLLLGLNTAPDDGCLASDDVDKTDPMFFDAFYACETRN